MRHEAKPVASVLTILGIVALLFSMSMIPEMRRYLRMRRM